MDRAYADSCNSDCVVVVPCFNEVDRLAFDEMKALLVVSKYVRFIFVDDGSTDRTAEVIGAFCESVGDSAALLRLHPNVGKGEAVRAGVHLATESNPKYIAYWDADGATPWPVILDMIDRLESNGEVNIILGSRVPLLGYGVQRSPFRRFLGRASAVAVSNIFGIRAYDTQCGAKCMRNTDVLSSVFAAPFISRWLFDLEILLRMRNLCGNDINAWALEMPLCRWRDVSGSTLTIAQVGCAALDLARIAYRYAMSPYRVNSR